LFLKTHGFKNLKKQSNRSGENKMKTITLEIEDNYWLEISTFLKKFPIKIIEEKNEKISLSKQDAKVVFDLIANPPKPNIKMREAVKIYQQSELNNAQS
jgi:hypothetical protein